MLRSPWCYDSWEIQTHDLSVLILADGTTTSPVCSLNFESNENNSKFQNQFSGITYDRKDIEEHLQRVGHFDPVTRSVSFTPF